MLRNSILIFLLLCGTAWGQNTKPLIATDNSTQTCNTTRMVFSPGSLACSGSVATVSGGSISLPSGQVGYGTGSGITSASTFTYNTTNGITVNRVDINDLTADGSTRALNITSQEPFPVTVTGTVPTKDSQTDLVVGNNVAGFIMGARDDGTTFLQASSSTPMLRIEQGGGDIGNMNVQNIDVGENGTLGITGTASVFLDGINGNITLWNPSSIGGEGSFYLYDGVDGAINIGDDSGGYPISITEGGIGFTNSFIGNAQASFGTFSTAYEVTISDAQETGYDIGDPSSSWFISNGGSAYFSGMTVNGSEAISTNLTLGSGTHNFYYCSAGVSIGQVCRGNGCTCVGGTETAIPTLTL